MRIRRLGPYWLPAGLILILSGLWIWLYRPVFDYLSIIFSQQEFRTNQILLLAIVALIASRLRHARLRLPQPEDLRPRLNLSALVLLLTCSVLYLGTERFFDIRSLSAALFGLATYGLLGLWMEPHRWREGFLAALLLVGVLPFGDHLETFVGYPMRRVTAQLVRDGFASLGHTSLGVDTILVFESGVAKVDLPCSGVKSLWTGLLFLLSAAWIERHPINLRWLLAGGVMGILLFCANLLRVAGLIGTGQVLGWSLLAEMLHVPLGVLGFVAACAGALFILRRPRQMMAQPALARSHPRPLWLAPTLCAVILGLALLYTPRPVQGASSTSTWQYPVEMNTTPQPLSTGEIDWITSGGADSADRQRFQSGDLGGSLILIRSRSWRGQHRPERCFEVYGLTVDNSYTQLASSDFPMRVVKLSDPASGRAYTAAYWFQSATQTTDDYGTRMWSDLAPQREEWVLVTVLFDRSVDPQDQAALTFFSSLREVVHEGMVK